MISGEWRPASGVRQARWAMVSVSTDEHSRETKDATLAVVPTASGLIGDTWNVAGMRATGSDTLIFENVFVPDDRLLSFEQMTSGAYVGVHPDEPLTASTIVSALTVTVVAPLLGMGEAALDYALDSIRPVTSTAPAKSSRSRDSSSVKNLMADAASLIDTARLHAYRALADVERGITEKSQLDSHLKSRVHMDAGIATKSLRESISIILSVTGSASFSLENPIQRIWRDLEFSSTHMNIAPDRAREDYGQALFSRPREPDGVGSSSATDPV